MISILNTLLSITVYTIILFLGILIFKKVFHKYISAKLNYLVWMLLVLRLLVPFTISSGFSFFVIPAQPLPVPLEQSADSADIVNYKAFNEDFMQKTDDKQQSNEMDTTQGDNAAAPLQNYTSKPDTPRTDINWADIAVFVWLSGIAVSLACMTYLRIRFNRLVKRGRVETPGYVLDMLEECKEDLHISANITLSVQNSIISPGLTLSLHPKLLLPSGMLRQMDISRIEFGIRHELTHFKRRDHLVRFLIIILRCVYWFNPVVWLAFGRINADMEAACDAQVTADYSREQRKQYVETIIFLSCDKKIQYALGMGVSNGRRNIERRVEGIFMKKKTKLSVRITAVLLAGLMLLICFTTACQPTPAKPIIVNKNKDLAQVVQNQESAPTSVATTQPYATGKKLKDIVLPTDRYKFKSEDTAASLTINVDADITKPESDKMPFARVKTMDFTQEQVTGMFNYLFPDKKPYNIVTVQTKDDITNSIAVFQKYLATGKFGDGEKLSDEDKEHTKQEISSLEKQRETAPDQRPPLVASDGTLQKVTRNNKDDAVKAAAGGSTASPPKVVTTTDYELQVSLNKATLSINTGSTDSKHGMDNNLLYTNTDRNFSTDGMKRVNPGDTLPKAAQSKLKLPLKDAIAKADGFFNAAGIKDVKLFASYLVDDHGTGHVNNDWSAASHFAYELFYTRTVNGVPISCNASEGTGGSDDDYSKPLFYETIEFLVSDDGIIKIHWMEPCKATEIVQDDCGLVDFDTAVQAFEKAVDYTYGQYAKDYSVEDSKTTIDVNVDNIRLDLVRLKEKDKPDERLYVPAYVFYGAVKEKQVYQSPKPYTHEGYMTSAGGGSDFYPGPIMVMAINAVDGSIIDTMKDVY